ncbi:MAG: UDP-2,3-diacylglucosamine diphosphatase [Planctomycetota bacterium]
MRIATNGLRIFGTRVFDLAATERPTVVLSDLHVPQGGGPVVGWLGELLDDAAAQGARVLVLGDLFDSYVTPRQLGVGIWREVADRFAAATAGGAEIAVLHGNRDFLLGAEWERATGAVVVPGGLRTVLAGKKALLLHGDELCRNDLPYQRAKKWLRRPWTKGLARRLPLPLAHWVAARARRKSQRVTRAGDQGRFLPTADAIATALRSGVERVVFGHIHRLAHGAVPEGDYLVLPAFDEAGVRLVVRDRFELEEPGGRPFAGELQPLPLPGAGTARDA